MAKEKSCGGEGVRALDYMDAFPDELREAVACDRLVVDLGVTDGAGAVFQDIYSLQDLRLIGELLDQVLDRLEHAVAFRLAGDKEKVRSDPAHSLVGREIGDLVDPSEREGMRVRVRQSLEGARMHISAVRLTRLDGLPICADAALGDIVWDGVPAVQILLRPASPKGAKPASGR